MRDVSKCIQCGSEMSKSSGTWGTGVCEKCFHGKDATMSMWGRGLRLISLVFLVAGMIASGIFGLLAFESMAFVVGREFATLLGWGVFILFGLLVFVIVAAVMVFLDLACDVAAIRSKIKG